MAGAFKSVLISPRRRVCQHPVAFPYDSFGPFGTAERLAKARARGAYSKGDFLALCKWKSPRTAPRCAENTEAFIEAVTSTSLSTPCEQLRIESLTLLRGVNWPTASVLLHFAHPDPYPILDFRALWSLGIENVPLYEFRFWWEYVTFTRALATKAGVSMRILDRSPLVILEGAPERLTPNVAPHSLRLRSPPPSTSKPDGSLDPLTSGPRGGLSSGALPCESTPFDSPRSRTSSRPSSRAARRTQSSRV